jgi:excisionase family DNA binding protein
MQPTDMLAERLFATPAEVAELLDMDPRTVRAALQRGEIPGFKVGAWWKIPTAWLRSQAGIGDDDAASA